jgi:hypothetical protein
LKKRLFLLFVFCTSILLQAQEPVSIHLSEKNGLPDKEFYDITEDNKGFIWLSAAKGLFRYDGKSFKNYSNEEQRGISVFGVKQDRLGRIWCNNISGQFFYIQDDKLRLFIDLSKQLKGELPQFVVRGKYLWVFSGKSIYQINLTTKLIESNKLERFGTPFIEDNTIFVSNTDSITSISSRNIFKSLVAINLPLKGEKGHTIPHGKSRIFKIASSLFLSQKRSGVNTIFLVDVSKKIITKASGLEAVSRERIYTEFKNENELWIGTGSGVFVYEYKSNNFRLKKRFLKSKDITKIIKDKEDNYWLTTLNNGVYVIPNINIEAAVISEKNKNISSLDVIDDNTLVYGTKAGDIGFYDVVTNIEKHVELPSKDRVSVIKYQPEIKMVFISKDLESYIYNYKSTHLSKINKVKKFNTAKSITLLKNNDLLLTSYSSVLKIENADISNDETFISNGKRTYASHYNKTKNEVYVAFVDDLVKYDSIWNPKKIQFEGKSIYGNSMSETANGFIWVSTFKNGVFGIKNDSVIHHYTTKNGLSSNYIGKIKADKNELWISLENSIQVLDVITGQLKTLTKREGILSYDISGIEILNNKVFFSSNVGLFSVAKEKAFKKQNPEIYFNNLEINEKDTIIVSNYKLNYNQNTLKIGFNVNGFLYNQKEKYKYRLKGLNDSWLVTDLGVNSVKYNSLSAGNYTFQVQTNTAKNKKKIIELTFIISKPYWRTWWFIWGISILILGSTIWYFINKIKIKEKERIALLEKLSLEKELININLTALRSQMNPHFIFNALNSIQDLVLKQDTEASYDSIVLFAELIRNTLSYSSQDFISIDKELDFLKVYLQLENLRFGDEFTYTISTNLKENLEIPSLLIQPFIENALVHGLLHKNGEKELNIEFTFIDNSLQCVITDNGIGRCKASEISNRQGNHHESFALGAIEKRLEIFKKQYNEHIGYSITDLYENEVAKGTKVIVTMPFKRKF